MEFNEYIENCLSMLKDIEPQKRIAFGAICCESLKPFYKVFYDKYSWGEYRFIERCCESFWDCINNKYVDTILRAEREYLLKITPGDDKFPFLFGQSAQKIGVAYYYMYDYILSNDLNSLKDSIIVQFECIDFYEERFAEDDLLELGITNLCDKQYDLNLSNIKYLKNLKGIDGKLNISDLKSRCKVIVDPTLLIEYEGNATCEEDILSEEMEMLSKIGVVYGDTIFYDLSSYNKKSFLSKLKSFFLSVKSKHCKDPESSK